MYVCVHVPVYEGRKECVSLGRKVGNEWRERCGVRVCKDWAVCMHMCVCLHTRAKTGLCLEESRVCMCL